MYNKIRFYVIVILYIVTASSMTMKNEELYEGSECVLDYGGIGMCTKITDCPEKLEEVKFGMRDATGEGRCGFVGFEEIVCCSTDVKDKATLRPAELACEELLEEKEKWMKAQEVAIFGGYRSIQGEFPFIVALGFENSSPEDESGSIKYSCGGALISYEHVLTAAHCARNINEFVPVEVYMGSVKLNEKWTYVKRIRISNITMHPLYKRSRGYNDIAILKLEEKLEFSDAIQPVCIYPENPWTSNRNKILVAGWGATSVDGYVSDELIQTPYIGLIENEECTKDYQNYARLPNGIIDSMLCTRDPNKTRNSDACEGDSGGPLISRLQRYDGIIGVTALGQLCGSSTPGVYTAIYPYLEWIEKQVWG